MSLNEADTCRKFVVPALQKAGWDNDPHSITEQRTFGAHLWSGEEAILNQHIFRVVPRFEMLARFVQEGLNALVDEMADQVRGLEMFHIRKQELDRMLFPVPSLDVQRRVVHQLDAYRDLCRRVRTEQESRSRRVRSLAPSVLDRVFAGGL